MRLRALSVQVESERALLLKQWSHFLTENRCPLFRKMLYKPACSRARSPPQSEVTAGNLAVVISGQAGTANIGPYSVDRARGRYADIPDKGRATVALAPHPSGAIVD